MSHSGLMTLKELERREVISHRNPGDLLQILIDIKRHDLKKLVEDFQSKFDEGMVLSPIALLPNVFLLPSFGDAASRKLHMLAKPMNYVDFLAFGLKEFQWMYCPVNVGFL